MNRILMTLAAVLVTSAVAQAGPVCDRIAANRAARQQARASSRATCPGLSTPVRTAAHVVSDRVGQVVQAQPVRAAVGNVLMTAGQCVAGVCPR